MRAIEEFRSSGKARAQLENQVEEERILQELSCLAFSDPRQLFDTEGRMLDPAEWPEHVARAVASFKVKQTASGKAQIMDIKMIDKVRPIELAGKTKRMFVDRVEHVHDLKDLTDEELAEELAKIRAKARETGSNAEAHGHTIN